MLALVVGIILMLAVIFSLGLMIDSSIAAVAVVGYVLAAMVVIVAAYFLVQIVKTVKN